jgi:hypothetical protein
VHRPRCCNRLIPLSPSRCSEWRIRSTSQPPPPYCFIGSRFVLKKKILKVLHGNLFDSAIMKTSVISDDFRRRYLSDPTDPTVAHVWALAVAVATGIFFAVDRLRRSRRGLRRSGDYHRPRSPVFKSARPPPIASSGDALRIEDEPDVPDRRPSPMHGSSVMPA